MPKQFNTAFISTRALASRWGCRPAEARATMERHGFALVPYGTRSWRWRVVEVEKAEGGQSRPSILRQMVEEVRGR